MKFQYWLQNFYGINFVRTKSIYAKAGLRFGSLRNLDVHYFKFYFMALIKKYFLENYIIERILRLRLNIWLKFILKLDSFKALRLKFGLPANGQRSKSNAKTARRLRIKFLAKK